MAKIEHENLASMSLGDHLEELRMRLMFAIGGIIVGMIAGMAVSKYMVSYLVNQYKDIMTEAGKEPNMLFIEVADPIFVFLKMSLVIGIVLTAPWIFYQMWAFISSGLYKNEKKFVYTAIPACTILFVTGAVFFFKSIAPLAMTFFVNFNFGVDFLNYSPTLKSYINFILTLTVVFGLGFQLPVVVIFANKLGLLTIEMLRKGRKFVILGLFIVAAIATPPDIISQIALAMPLLVLYEASIIFCQISHNRKKKKEQQQ